MTVRNKIRLSNILMILIPLFVTAAVIWIFMATSFGNYWYSMELMYEDKRGLQSAQSLIYTYQKELWENNWGAEIPKEKGEPIRQNAAMYHLERKLEAMGYYIQVTKNGNEIYSNISDENLLEAAQTAGEGMYLAQSMTMSTDKMSVVKNTFFHEGKEFAVLAVNIGQDNRGPSYLQNYILRYILILCLTFFLMVIVVNGVLSYWVSRSVLEPLKKLSRGTKRIIEGDLTADLDYHKQDEFGQVCQDFEKMCAYLSESARQRVEDERRRSELLLGISHDLRTPLTSISGYLEGLMTGIANTPEKQERYLKAIETRTQDMKRMLDSLSEYVRLESGRLNYHMKQGDLRSFLEEYLLLYQEDLKKNHVAVRLMGAQKKYPCCFDENEMKRVFDNLFSNTIRYRNKQASKVELRLYQKKDVSHFVCEFADDGPGVAERCLCRLFDTFFRTDEARSNVESGSGIGLAVVKKIIEEHGGQIRARNEHGLVIEITLPRGQDSGEQSDETVKKHEE